MVLTTGSAKSILTAQTTGFLASAPYPFTHTLSAYTGCGFGLTTCGMYCYAQFMPNWTKSYGNAVWGSSVRIKINAAELLEDKLRNMRTEKRRIMRIFMSSTTDPYQPAESKYQITRQCLEVFTRYNDLDLLVIQTRAPLAARDFDLIHQIPYVWLSITIETDDQTILHNLRGGPSIQKRFALIHDAQQHGIKTQIAVSPCLPYTEHFARVLAKSGAQRIIIDNCIDGDGASGRRTARSLYAAQELAWRDTNPSRLLFEQLVAEGTNVSWSAAGFCGIPPQSLQSTLFE